VAPYRLDARRCISYLTIEHEGPIPLELRPLIGNRVVGCDDCQLVCPWNKYAARATLPDFDERAGLAGASLRQLWGWTEADFLRRTEGSAIRRIGWARWRRNLAVAIGNALRAGADDLLAGALQAGRQGADANVQEHIDWALSQRPQAHGAPAGDFSSRPGS
jgi:epoxyqueuosine reductase